MFLTENLNVTDFFIELKYDILLTAILHFQSVEKQLQISIKKDKHKDKK